MTNRDLRSARGRARIARNGEGKRRGGDGDDSAIKERRTTAHAAAAAWREREAAEMRII
jgi:hypothetical protein